MAGKALLESQSKRIESLISIASNSVQMLCDPKAHKELLAAERNKLLLEVERLKAALIAAEIRNGKKQVFSSFLGIRSSFSEKSSQNTAPSTSSIAPSSEPASETKPASKPAKPEKPAKVKEPKGGAKTDSPACGAPAAPEVVDVSRLDMRIGLIVEAGKHPDADNLYVEQVDVGEGKTRTVVSGLAKHVPLEAMQKRLCIFLCNLKPAKLKGISSEAMVMCANKDGVVEIISPPAGSKPGDRVVVKGYPGQPDAELNPKKKIWEQVMPDLRTDLSGNAAYKEVPWTVNGENGYCTCSLHDAQIK